MHVHPLAYVCITYLKAKKQIPWITSRGLNWESKTYKLKRSFGNEEEGIKNRHDCGTITARLLAVYLELQSNKQQKRVAFFATLLQNGLIYDVSGFTTNHSNVSCNKVGWILTSDWIRLREIHNIHASYVKSAGKTQNMNSFFSKVELFSTFCDNFSQDRFDSWMVKRAALLLSLSCSNFTKLVSR